MDGIANARVEVTALAPRDDDVAATRLLLATDPVAQTASGPPGPPPCGDTRVVDPDGHLCNLSPGRFERNLPESHIGLSAGL